MKMLKHQITQVLGERDASDKLEDSESLKRKQGFFKPQCSTQSRNLYNEEGYVIGESELKIIIRKDFVSFSYAYNFHSGMSGRTFKRLNKRAFEERWVSGKGYPLYGTDELFSTNWEDIFRYNAWNDADVLVDKRDVHY